MLTILQFLFKLSNKNVFFLILLQLNAFLEGFYDIIPKYLISIFNEQELELLISGLPTVDIDDLKANTEYHKYNVNSLQVLVVSLPMVMFYQKFAMGFLLHCFFYHSWEAPQNG